LLAAFYAALSSAARTMASGDGVPGIVHLVIYRILHCILNANHWETPPGLIINITSGIAKIPAKQIESIIK